MLDLKYRVLLILPNFMDCMHFINTLSANISDKENKILQEELKDWFDDYNADYRKSLVDFIQSNEYDLKDAVNVILNYVVNEKN